jgi:hypothetical protein
MYYTEMAALLLTQNAGTYGSRDSSFGIAPDYGLDDQEEREFESR